MENQTNQLNIDTESDDSEFTRPLPKLTIKEGTNYSEGFTSSLTLKEIVRYHLLTIQHKPGGSEVSKQTAERAAIVIDLLVISIRYKESKTGENPYIEYDLIDISSVDVVDEQDRIDFAIPDKSDQKAYFGYFDRLVYATLHSPTVVMILRAIMLDRIRYNKNHKARKRPKTQLAPKGGYLSGNLKIGIHSLRQTYGDQKDVPIFEPSQLELWETQYSAPITNEIDRYGVALTDLQHKVMEGILMGLTQTNYRGNTSLKTREEIAQGFSSASKLPKIYDNVNEIPRLRVQQRELARLCTIDENSQSEYAHFLEALTYLATTQFCFYYTRSANDKNGKLEKDSRGNWLKETVEAVGTLFSIKTVRDKNTDEFKYYEIEPSPLFLDQYESYFLLIPYGWREEVKAIVGAKRASSYTMKFLLYLRYQFEERRRKNASNTKRRIPYEIKTSWLEIAKALKMPESVYRGQKDRAIKIIDQAYQVAQTTGYLKAIKHTAGVDILVLNPDKYPAPMDAIDSSVELESRVE